MVFLKFKITYRKLFFKVIQIRVFFIFYYLSTIVVSKLPNFEIWKRFVFAFERINKFWYSNWRVK
jgi:hypothetical protein